MPLALLTTPPPTRTFEEVPLLPGLVLKMAVFTIILGVGAVKANVKVASGLSAG